MTLRFVGTDPDTCGDHCPGGVHRGATIRAWRSRTLRSAHLGRTAPRAK